MRRFALSLILIVLYAVLGGCSLTVNIEPAAVRAFGAQWRVYGGGWHESGETVRCLWPGPCTVSFSDIAGWVKPPDEQVTISVGSPVSIVAVYTLPDKGASTVTMAPAEAEEVTATPGPR